MSGEARAGAAPAVRESLERWLMICLGITRERAMADNCRRKVDFCRKSGALRLKMRQNRAQGDESAMNPPTWQCGEGCKGRFWAMITARLSPVSAGQPAQRGSRGGGRDPGASRMVEPNLLPARLIHEPTV